MSDYEEIISYNACSSCRNGNHEDCDDLDTRHLTSPCTCQLCRDKGYNAPDVGFM